jgi:hypothetical protein
MLKNSFAKFWLQEVQFLCMRDRRRQTRETSKQSELVNVHHSSVPCLVVIKLTLLFRYSR